MKEHYLGLKFSFSYFTTLPIRFCDKDNLSTKPVLASMLFFLPFVGLSLGLLTITIYMLLSSLGWYAAVIAAVAYMALYGFLHLEAVMDVADALYASHSGKDAYKIIKEPTVGAMGVFYAIGAVILKVSGIVFLLLHEQFIPLLLIFMLSRIGLLMLFYVHTFRSTFLTELKEAFILDTKKYRLSALIIYTSIGLILFGYLYLIVYICAMALSYIISHQMKRNLGFVNGDVLGATLESVEVLLLLGAALWL